MTMVAFDVETTGLEAEKEEIVEIGAVRFTFNREGTRMQPDELGTFQQLIDPIIKIPAEVTAINHITNDMVKGMPKVDQVLPDFLRFCIGANFLVAHNAEFDAEFIGRALRRHNMDPGKTPILDSIKIIKKTNFEFRSFKLGNIVAKLAPEMRLKHDATRLHRATYDCRALAHVLTCCLRKRFPPENFEVITGQKALTKLHGKPMYFGDF